MTWELVGQIVVLMTWTGLTVNTVINSIIREKRGDK